MTLIEKLIARCTEDGDCLIWNGSQDLGGRPRMTVRVEGMARTIQPRRVMYQSNGRPLDRSKRVTPSCGHPLCINPDHLKAITPGQVISRAAQRPATKLRRHVAGLASRARSQLDMDVVRQIRASEKSGAQISRETGIPQTTVSAIRTYKRWNEVLSNPFAGLTR